MTIAKKSPRAKRAAITEPAPEPTPMPPTPPGPSSSLHRNLHGTATLSMLLLVTAVVFLALSLGLSVFNTIELAKMKKTLKFVERLDGNQADVRAAAAAEPATSDDPEELIRRADDMMIEAEALIDRASELESASTTDTTKLK